MNLKELVKKIERSFDNEELDELCFSLHINYQNLAGSTLRSKVIALVKHCARHNLLDELLRACRVMRPRETWVLDESLISLDMLPEDSVEKLAGSPRYFWTIGVFILAGLAYLFLSGRLGEFLPAETADVGEGESTVTTIVRDNGNALEGTPNSGTTVVSVENDIVSTEVLSAITLVPDSPTDSVMPSPTLTSAAIPTNTLTPTNVPIPTNTPTPITPTATPECSSAPLKDYVFFNSGTVPEFGDPRPMIVYDGLLGQCVLSFPDNAELVVRHTEQSRNFIEPINGTIEVLILENVYPEGGGNLSHYFITKGNAELGINVYGLRVADNGGFGAILIDEDATSNAVNSGPNKILLNCWQRVAFRWNNGFADIFVDGEKVSNGMPTYSPVPGLGLNYSGSPGVRIGQGLFEGKIAGVYFYDYARSDEEIRADATNYPLCQP